MNFSSRSAFYLSACIGFAFCLTGCPFGQGTKPDNPYSRYGSPYYLGGGAATSFNGSDSSPSGGPLSGFQGSVVSSGNCAKVIANCQSHSITITTKDGKTSTDDINCGKPGNSRCGGTGETMSGKGVVGGPHHGTVVPNGIDIQTPGMGQQGGGKVFHLPSPRPTSGAYWGRGTPSKVNNTCGCIAVSLRMIQTLNNCKGAPLEIIGTDRKGRSIGPSAPPPDSRYVEPAGQ